MVNVNIGDCPIDFEKKAVLKGKEFDFKLSDLKGNKIVLYFYPKDLTPGCSAQAENLRDNFKELENKVIKIVGISPDSIKKHINFIEKKNLPFILVSDEVKEVLTKYGVWQLKKFMGKEYMGVVRTTILIDENFKIVDIISKPKVKIHNEEILKGFNLN